MTLNSFCSYNINTGTIIILHVPTILEPIVFLLIISTIEPFLLINFTTLYVPVAIESMGAYGPKTVAFIRSLGTGDR